MALAIPWKQAVILFCIYFTTSIYLGMTFAAEISNTSDWENNSIVINNSRINIISYLAENGSFVDREELVESYEHIENSTWRNKTELYYQFRNNITNIFDNVTTEVQTSIDTAAINLGQNVSFIQRCFLYVTNSSSFFIIDVTKMGFMVGFDSIKPYTIIGDKIAPILTIHFVMWIILGLMLAFWSIVILLVAQMEHHRNLFIFKPLDPIRRVISWFW